VVSADVAADPRLDAAWAALAAVPDPEVPALSVVDLGIVREVLIEADGVRAVLTPTYSGCPATEVIAATVRDALQGAGFGPVNIEHRLAPAWSSDWISDAGRRKLRDYGIAPPGGGAHPAAQCRMPALRQSADRTPVGLRLDRLQGPAPLPGLPRTFRALQADMSLLDFRTLTVHDVRPEADDARVVSFDVPQAMQGEFTFQPGQYLTLRRPGIEPRRSYSICPGCMPT
jgi:ring-1,2-phenylacetyl-CoA epoxidase subunit PaaD